MVYNSVYIPVDLSKSLTDNAKMIMEIFLGRQYGLSWQPLLETNDEIINIYGMNLHHVINTIDTKNTNYSVLFKTKLAKVKYVQ